MASAPVWRASSSDFVRDPAHVKLTDAPSRAKRLTIAAPIPRLPPMTKTFLPENSAMLCSPWFCIDHYRTRKH
ncbi:hypothetical protein APS_2793 [Acetobacter pasteurianus subsp. pasteurianus LMG 1262 = NBRC 106471]|nr:hypothetical protein APS_2793 [Acetobacter pasteurianus subsp. pasteurianus LMG 1262 = NBRC 106471]